MLRNQPQTQKYIQNQQLAALKEFCHQQSSYFRQLSSKILPENQAQFIQLTYSIKGQRNLIAKRYFQEKQIIFSISFNQMLDQSQSTKSRFSQYLYWLNNNQINMPQWKILGEYQSHIYLKQLICEHSSYNLIPQMYLFQLKFMTKYSNNNNQYMWFIQYVDILPQDFSFMPHHYIHFIQKYHRDIASSLQQFYESLRHAYELLKELIQGKNIPQQWNFSTFLKNLQQDYGYYFHKYCQQFTFDNFQWAYLTWKTRSFDREKNNGLITIFVPIIDMINHSKTQKNAQWVFIQSEHKLIMKTIKHINAFQELFIDYGQRSMQQFFQNYGFLLEQQKCLINVKVQHQNSSNYASFCIDPTLSIEQMIIYLKQQHFSKIKQQKQILYRFKLIQSIVLMTAQKQKSLQQLRKDVQIMKFTQEERYILKQVKIILKNEVQYLKLLISAMNLIYFK